ncbi:HlyD family secretion protein [Siccibacter turicensis]|uniref:efflux RND transporter periplasmic adaptor subunit n=1 Tax=Siccibacter turicensis TaxID=357233 RepID=UPI0023F27502|nr:HlyD family secretion protein [Siccibacter turicensis]
MAMKTLKYFSTLLVFAVALVAGWIVWNYYMQSPWTRDGKVRAEQVDITPQVSGTIQTLQVSDNQYVHAGDVLFTLDATPYEIAILNAQAQLARSEADLTQAQSEAARRQHLPRNYISAEDLETARITVKAKQAERDAAQATLKQAQWQLGQTRVTAPVDGWVTNLATRPGNYATEGQPVFALIDSHSFYVVGYFEETKLRHIQVGDRAHITLYSSDTPVAGRVASIGRAIYDQSVESDSKLVPDIKPNVPWVRLAQRIPVRIALDTLPAGVTLVSGTTCTVSLSR